MAEAYDYTITVRRVEEDGEVLFVARVKELPHVRGEGATFNEAYEMAVDAIQTLQQLAVELGKSFPAPATMPEEEWSGRLSLRLPKSLHRKAAERADEEGVSLNQFLNSIIAEAIGGKSARAVRTIQIDPFNHYHKAIEKWFELHWTKPTIASYSSADNSVLLMSTALNTPFERTSH